MPENETPSLVPLSEAFGGFDEDLRRKIVKFLGYWLPEVEKNMDAKGLEAQVYVVYEQPYTEGGPFQPVPKAILTAEVDIRGPFHPKPEEKRRGMVLALQNMMSWPDPVIAAKTCESKLVWFSRPESYYLPG